MVWKPNYRSKYWRSRRAVQGIKVHHHNPKFLELDKKWIDSIPKIINSNGCWIPTELTPDTTGGYIKIDIEGKQHMLHRLVLCVYYSLNYYDQSWVSRHGKDCNRACFNLEHLKIGTDSDNVKDSVEHKTHKESRKEVCPKCGGEYEERKLKSGINKGKTWRYCPRCRNDWVEKNREKLNRRRRKKK